MSIFWYRFRLTTSLWNQTFSILLNIFLQCENYLRCFALLLFPVISRPTLLGLRLTGCLFKLITNFRNQDTIYTQFQNEVHLFLLPRSESQPTRQRPGAGVNLAGLSAPVLFGGGVAKGS